MLSLAGKFTRLSLRSPPSSCHWGIGELFHMSALSISGRNMGSAPPLSLSRSLSFPLARSLAKDPGWMLFASVNPARAPVCVYLFPCHHGWFETSRQGGNINQNNPSQEF